MNSYFLANTRGPDVVREALDRLLPAQRHPWVLVGAGGDAICYVNIGNFSGYDVQLDVSGRYSYRDERILTLLRALRAQVGGIITDDFDAVID